MTTCYLDTSALVKRYVNEVGSSWLRGLLGSKAPPAIVVVHFVTVEVTSALMRRLREGVLNTAEYEQAQDAFHFDCLHEYDMVTAVGEVIDRARRLVEKHPLRAYDAVHLSAALIVDEELLANDLPPLLFMSADDRLNHAASAEGLAVDNPNNHP